ncbi:MAG: AraC family transcriptional regulator [Steroidobacteraceae bacterium]
MDKPSAVGVRGIGNAQPLGPAPTEPSVRARALYGFHEVATRNGGDPEQMLNDCGIDPSRLADPDYPVPGLAVARLLEHAAKTLQTPDFGLQLSEFHDASILGTVAMVVLNSDTVGTALDAVASNIQFHNPGARVRVTAYPASGDALYEHEPGLDADGPRRQPIEMIYAIVFRLLCTLTGESGSDWRVRFRHRRGAAPSRYRRYFPCAIEFGHDRDCIEFPARLLRVRIDRADPALRALATRYLAQLQRKYPSDLRRQVAELIRRQLPNGGGKIALISAILGLHPKTLQRRLRDENTSFHRIADDVRRALAQEYLVFSVLPLPEVAALLGYSGQTAFIVACRRWFGATPKRFRSEFIRRTATAVESAGEGSPGARRSRAT